MEQFKLNDELKKIIWKYNNNEYRHIIDNEENKAINFAHYFLSAHSTKLIRKYIKNEKEVNYRLLLDAILDIGIYNYSEIVKQYNAIGSNIYHNNTYDKFVENIKNKEINEIVKSLFEYYDIEQNDSNITYIRDIIENIKKQKLDNDIIWHHTIYNKIVKKFGEIKIISLIDYITSAYNDPRDNIMGKSITKLSMYGDNTKIDEKINQYKNDLQNTLNSIQKVENKDDEAKKLFDLLRNKIKIDGRKKYKEIDDDASDGCFAILDTNDNIFYSLSGTKDYVGDSDLYEGCSIKHDADFIYQSLKLGKDVFGNKSQYAYLKDNVIKYYEYNGREYDILPNPVTLGTELLSKNSINGRDYSCCERKIHAAKNNEKNVNGIYIVRFLPCKNCQASLISQKDIEVYYLFKDHGDMCRCIREGKCNVVKAQKISMYY